MFGFFLESEDTQQAKICQSQPAELPNLRLTIPAGRIQKTQTDGRKKGRKKEEQIQKKIRKKSEKNEKKSRPKTGFLNS